MVIYNISRKAFESDSCAEGERVDRICMCISYQFILLRIGLLVYVFVSLIHG
jgi:hypothetical protein